MYEDLPSHSSSIDAIALYGENSITSNFSRLFSSVGIDVYFISSKSDQISSLNPSFTTTKTDLPYLSSVLINCQDDLIEMKNFLDLFPNDYKQRMAYVECSSYLRQNQLEEFYDQMKFSYYLCMNFIELESSTMIQPNIQLICSGKEIVFHKLILQTNLPVKGTFLNHCQSPFDAFYIGLFHRYSQAIHLAIYAEMMAIFKAANPIYPGNFHSNTLDCVWRVLSVGNLQYLFDWSYVKRPIMRQMILQSPSSSFTFTSIHEFQLLLECMMDYFDQKSLYPIGHHLIELTRKLHQFISRLTNEEKDKSLFELFTLY